MPEEGNHECRYTYILEADGWRKVDQVLQRNLVRVPRCKECGAERPARRTRLPAFTEEKSVEPMPSPEHRPHAREVAKELIRRVKGHPEGANRPTKGLFGYLGKKGMTQSRVEKELDGLMQAGWVQLRWKISGTHRSLHEIAIINPAGLLEFAKPGMAAKRAEAIEQGLKELAHIYGPISADVISILESDESGDFYPELIRALVAVARHVETGDILAERVFSSRYLGDSKELNRLQSRIEFILGPLRDLGIRETAGLTLLGGKCLLRFHDQTIKLDHIGPYIGLTREGLYELKSMQFPDRGLFFTENLTVFEACCKREVADAVETLVVWTAGMPGRAIRYIVEKANIQDARIRVWADVDLSGVRIYRLINDWSGGNAVAYRMGPDEVENEISQPLSQGEAKRIKIDLERQPTAPLSDTLSKLLERNAWIEQESML